MAPLDRGRIVSSKILINVRPSNTRVAYVESGELRDLKIEKAGENKSLVGSVFMGKVIRILPGMQAAFVDIGLDRAAFLYVGDVRLDVSRSPDMDWAESDGENIFPQSEEEQEASKIPIQDILKEGQLLLIQVAKDPIGTKGARITTHISLPGRHVVYMPTVNHIGISRKIEDEQERERLKAIIDICKPEVGGIIVRTAAEDASREDIENDIDYLVRVYREVNKTQEKKKSVGIVREELDMELRALRDMATEDVQQILVDDLETHKKLVKFVTQFLPYLKTKIELYEGTEPIFDQYGIDLEISRSLGRKVWLKSGGYIIIDEAEALVAIDVNTGSYVGKKDLEDTILKTNLEAVKEITHQLRIRNCGGIIVLDFIDMEKEINREKVMSMLNEELKKDKARTNVSGMSTLGLVEMTRKRTQASLVKSLCQPCSYCEGRGYVKKESTIANEIFRQLEREGILSGVRSTIVHCHSKIADWVYEGGNSMLEYIELRLNRSIIFTVEHNFHVEQYDIKHQR
jgi:ribonuclease G